MVLAGAVVQVIVTLGFACLAIVVPESFLLLAWAFSIPGWAVAVVIAVAVAAGLGGATLGYFAWKRTRAGQRAKRLALVAGIIGMVLMGLLGLVGLIGAWQLNDAARK